MQKVFDAGSVTDRQEGEAYAVELTAGHDTPDLSYAAANRVGLLLYTRANLATRDPAGDAAAVADLADTLDLNRSPSPPLALVIDADTARRQLAEVSRYAPVWADVIASRGYAPVIRSEADVIYEVARGGSYFTGAWIDAFELGSSEGPAPDPSTVPGLPTDIYPAWRAYRYADGLSSAQDGILASIMPPPDPDAQQPAPEVPAAAQPSAFTPPAAPIGQADLDAVRADFDRQIADLETELAALRAELASIKATAVRGVDTSTAADPASDTDPAGQHAEPSAGTE